ncbi:MAG: hypothetical protein ACK5MA_08980 [Parachlamydiaceae bacterium]
MAFGKAAFGTLVLLAGVCLVSFWLLFSPSDHIQPLKEAAQKKEELFSKQERFRTERTILLSQDLQRKIGRLSSASSTLQYHQTEEKAVLMEEMADVVLLFQEELLNDGQLVVQLTAKKAHYNYDQELFSAEEVAVARYQLKGVELPETLSGTPYFQGVAERARIAFSEEKPTLFAYGLKAEFLP